MKADDLTPRMVEALKHAFDYEVRGPFVVARQGDTVFGVFGDWNADGEGYWETCKHCYLPLMGEHAKGL